MGFLGGPGLICNVNICEYLINVRKKLNFILSKRVKDFSETLLLKSFVCSGRGLKMEILETVTFTGSKGLWRGEGRKG